MKITKIFLSSLCGLSFLLTVAMPILSSYMQNYYKGLIANQSENTQVLLNKKHFWSQIGETRVFFYLFLTFVLIFMIFVFFLSGCTKKDTEKTKKFQKYESNFNEINRMLIGFLDNGNDGVYGVVKNDKHKVTNLYFDGDVVLNDSQLMAINNIDELFTTDFSMIYVSLDRIAYGGLGNEMYVYTFDGNVPDYYYSEDGKDAFKTYKLSDNWYLLIRKTWP